MSYYRPTRDESLFFRLPHDLPIVVSGRPVQDVDLEARVNRALLAEFNSETSGWKPKPAASDGEWSWSWRGLPQWGGWWQTLRGFFAGVLSTCAAFSLSYARS